MGGRGEEREKGGTSINLGRIFAFLEVFAAFFSFYIGFSAMSSFSTESFEEFFL